MDKSFETETCSRCRGTGKYSYCAEYSDKCFKCHGNGKVLSPRGLVAYNFFLSLSQIPLNEVKIGDRIECGGFTNNGRRYTYSAPVVGIERSNSPTHFSAGSQFETYYALKLFTEHEKYGKHALQGKDTNLVRVYRNNDKINLDKALEYQMKLTKKGTQRKIRGVK